MKKVSEIEILFLNFYFLNTNISFTIIACNFKWLFKNNLNE